MNIPYTFSGTVIHGKKLGRTIGYPTANMAIPHEIIDDGVYALSIERNGTQYKWVGTYRYSMDLFEAHIFDFDTDIYWETLTITLIQRIRDNKKFDSIDDLKRQIQKDSESAKKNHLHNLSTMYPTLDTIVLRTIDLYEKTPNLPKLDLTKFKTPIVVGSGNGYYTGRILFRHLGAFFATESEIEAKLENIESITDVVVVSASGEKHAPIILAAAKKHHKNTFLISSSEKSSGKDIADISIIMPKIEEPYTYNTSTYFGYMLAEDPSLDLGQLRAFIEENLEEEIQKTDFTKYSSFCIVIPDQFVLIREMFETKFIELFGRKIGRDVFSYEQMRHATTVVQDPNELFICFGNTTSIQYGVNQINLPVFDWTSYAAMMLVGYYTIGKIQSSLPPYFMDSIDDYCKRAKVQSGFDISPIVRA